MRLIKMFGLAAIAAVAAMAFVGASSAMATQNTQLCKTATNPCTSPVTTLHMELTAGTIFLLDGLEPDTNVLCLSVLALGEVLGLAEAPAGQQVHLSKLDFKECGVEGTGSHSNCTVKVLEESLPMLVDILNTGALEGIATALNGKLYLECTVFGFIKIQCEYDLTGLQFGVKSAGVGNGNGMLNAAGTTLTKLSGGELCPQTLKITQGLLEPLEEIYVES